MKCLAKIWQPSVPTIIERFVKRASRSERLPMRPSRNFASRRSYPCCSWIAALALLLITVGLSLPGEEDNAAQHARVRNRGVAARREASLGLALLGPLHRDTIAVSPLPEAPSPPKH